MLRDRWIEDGDLPKAAFGMDKMSRFDSGIKIVKREMKVCACGCGRKFEVIDKKRIYFERKCAHVVAKKRKQGQLSPWRKSFNAVS